jgi:diguanylate cyclase (GGDEF)-like protein
MAALTPDVTLPRVARTLHRLVPITSAIAIGAGVLVLLGWTADVAALKSILPGLVAMNPVTAIAFIALGLALAQLPRARRASELLAWAVALIGATKLLSFLGTFEFAIDRLLFASRLGTNQMAPNTAFNFLLLGVALATIDRSLRRVHWPAQFLAVISAMSSMLALIGYAYGVRSFYGIGSYIPMALHTALTFVVLAMGLLCARPERGIMSVISSDTTGGTMMRRLLPAVFVVPLLLGWMRLAGQRARLFDSDAGLWLLVVGMMTVFVVLIGWNGLLLFRFDVTRMTNDRTLEHYASHDALTRLPNRLLLTQELERALANADGRSTAILFIDLDRFKVINDSLGHVVGDELLIAAGERIAKTLEPGQMAARLGGDEFTVLLPNVTSENEPLDLARRLHAAFDDSFTLGPHEVFTTVSIGIAVSSGSETPLDLIRHADIAMYQAKARGRARHVTFDPSMDLAAVKRMALETELRRALAGGELRVYYQPECDIATGQLVGMEALVRWNHPVRGVVSPSEFLSVAEETGLILPIGRWVMFEACRQAKEWQDKYQPLMVSVNLSGLHFAQATLIDEVADVVEKTHIHPSQLILEITETVAMEGAQTTIETLRKLKALGVSLAIDDFGTGFSSLAYLKQFPVDYLKIDKSFVDGVASNGHDTAIVKAVIALGHALGLKMIAEGVETPEQVAQLQELGSEIGQGYFYAKPLAGHGAEGMPGFLENEVRS